MERRFAIHKQELLLDCEVSPEVFAGLLERLRPFAQPFLDCLDRQEQRAYAQTYLSGLLSDLKRKNAEAIAYYFDQDRRGLQHFPARVFHSPSDRTAFGQGRTPDRSVGAGAGRKG